MSSTGGPPSGSGGSDWIDRVLERAGEQTDRRPPIVPDPELDRTGQLPAVPSPRPITDELAQIQWAEGTPVRPASEPIAPQSLAPQQPRQADPYAHQAQPAHIQAPAQPQLTPQAVGRSAWADELRSVGSSDPEGWERLSWSDMDDNGGVDDVSAGQGMREPSVAGSIIREWGPVLIAAVAIALFTRLVLVQAYHIPSLSMAPTLEVGDRVIVNRLSYNFGEIERGQLLVFSKPPGQASEANDLIKRVVGLPGETIEFRDGEVYVDGLLVQEPYLAQQNSTRKRSLGIPGCGQETNSPEMCLVPEGYVFMMGDNRTGSRDSRDFGPVDIDTVVGRAFLRVWPLPDVGQL